VLNWVISYDAETNYIGKAFYVLVGVLQCFQWSEILTGVARYWLRAGNLMSLAVVHLIQVTSSSVCSLQMCKLNWQSLVEGVTTSASDHATYVENAQDFSSLLC